MDNLEGKVFVFTGTMSKERKEMEAIVKENGGETSSSVTKKVTHLVVGDEPGKSKFSKAKELEIEIIDEDQFWQMI